MNTKRTAVLLWGALWAGIASCQGGSCTSSGAPDAARPDSGFIKRSITLGRGQEVDVPLEMSASQILVSFKGAEGAASWVARSRTEARVRAKKIADRLRKAPWTFADTARRVSDGPHRREGGFLHSWRRGKMMPAFEQAVARISAGAVTGPVETIFGFHVIQRHRVLPNIKISASHLLVAYNGALRARDTVVRTREEAEAVARKLAAEVRAKPDTFGLLVRERSDGPRADQGGPMGVWTVGRNKKPPIFDRVISSLQVGQVAKAVVESPFGFHILKRTRVERPTMLAASHILIAYEGARRCPVKVSRSREEALALARKLARRLKARPYRFAQLARKYSDDPIGARGGHLGAWAKGKGLREFESAVLRLKVGQIYGPLETPAGYHIIQRHAVRK